MVSAEGVQIYEQPLDSYADIPKRPPAVVSPLDEKLIHCVGPQHVVIDKIMPIEPRRAGELMKGTVATCHTERLERGVSV